MPPRKRKRVARSRIVMVRGPRMPTPRGTDGRWKSVPEDILWGVYSKSPGRWPALAGMTRQVPALGYHLDFGVAARKLGVEVDGLAFHGGQEAWARDHQRQRRLEAAGWRVIRFTAREAAENPLGVLNEINTMWR